MGGVTYDNRMATRKGRDQKVWVAFCCTPRINWVSNNKKNPGTGIPLWAGDETGPEPWHAYVVAVIANPRGGGKEMVVWDCDPTEG